MIRGPEELPERCARWWIAGTGASGTTITVGLYVLTDCTGNQRKGGVVRSIDGQDLATQPHGLSYAMGHPKFAVQGPMPKDIQFIVFKAFVLNEENVSMQIS